jgi:hypothetical protein
MKVPKLAIALVHYPILDREKKIVATNITNFDIHDIARAATVYGVEKYFIVHPMREQLMFVERILDHWRVGLGAKFNPYRRTALANVCVAENLLQVQQAWKEQVGEFVTVVTHARPVEGVAHWSVQDFREKLKNQAGLLVFGTGFGLTDDFMKNADALLESIKGAPPKDYRHLSVRSAVSIYLDRILGPW